MPTGKYYDAPRVIDVFTPQAYSDVVVTTRDGDVTWILSGKVKLVEVSPQWPEPDIDRIFDTSVYPGTQKVKLSMQMVTGTDGVTYTITKKQGKTTKHFPGGF